MISVIVPTWNEADHLPATLRSLAANRARHEVVVADGGSTDATRRIAEGTGTRLLVSPRRQRAAQMNLGARHATGDALLFLHADTLLRADSLAAIELALARPCVVGGAFARRFDHPSRVLRLGGWLADWRGRLGGWFLGDQALFVRREGFARLRGFRECDRFEDLDFARRMRRLGRTVLLGPPILSSGRRFQAGVWRRMLHDAWLTCRYAAGTGVSQWY